MPAIVPDVPKVEIAIIASTNSARAEAHLAPVVANAQLAAIARAYAALLAKSNQFSHEADGSPASRVARAGYQACGVWENVAMRRSEDGFETRALAASTMEGWLKSPVHQRNILEAGVGEIGVGVARAADDPARYIAVQLFARPRSMAATIKVANASKQAINVSFEGAARTLNAGAVVTWSSCSGVLPLVFGAPISAKFSARDGAVYTVTGATGVNGVGGLRVVTTSRKSAAISAQK